MFFFHQPKVSNLIHFHKISSFSLVPSNHYVICLPFSLHTKPNKEHIVAYKSTSPTTITLMIVKHKIIDLMMETKTKYSKHQFQFSNSICYEHGYIKFHSCVLEQPFQC
jgi:hypothetical protein